MFVSLTALGRVGGFLASVPRIRLLPYLSPFTVQANPATGTVIGKIKVPPYNYPRLSASLVSVDAAVGTTIGKIIPAVKGEAPTSIPGQITYDFRKPGAVVWVAIV